MHVIKKVENPQYQTMREIAQIYWDNWLIISNLTDNPSGGIVRFYCYVNNDELTNIIIEMDKDYDVYGDCIIRFVGPNRGDSQKSAFTRTS